MAGFQEAVAQFKQASDDSDEVITEITFEDSKVDWGKTFRQGEVAMSKLIQREKHPDAVLCSNDDWAHGALSACADAGVRVPQDIAVTGFDNETFGEFGSVRLTTVAQPTEAMVDKAVGLLFQRLRGEPISAGEELIRLPCHVVVRQSCGASLRASRMEV
jgi:DNA-binding LacI/PurR family transcriptional regulator